MFQSFLWWILRKKNSHGLLEEYAEVFQSFLWWILRKKLTSCQHLRCNFPVSILLMVDSSEKACNELAPADLNVLFQSFLWWILRKKCRRGSLSVKLLQVSILLMVDSSEKAFPIVESSFIS